MALKIDVKMKPAETAEHFRKKGLVDPERNGFSFEDVEGEEHARIFTVAKPVSYDIVEMFYDEVSKAAEQGMTLQQFQKELKPRLVARGWWGKKLMTDPKTGVEKLVQLGSPTRLAIIFDTNMRTSRAVGRWKRIQARKDVLPYLKYNAVLDSRTRPLHEAWGRAPVILPVDHPWWETHFPPNGWRCRCIVDQLNDREIKRRGLKVTQNPPTGDKNYLNKRTGEVRKVPVGIDPGFDYNPGKTGYRAMTANPVSGKPERNVKLSKKDNPSREGERFPPPRPAPDVRLFSRTDAAGNERSDEFFINTFLNKFGTYIGGPEMQFIDVTGFPIVISERLFLTVDNSKKISKFSGGKRRELIDAMAKAIRDPDEIFNVVQLDETNNTTFLRRRYLANLIVSDEDGNQVKAPIFSIFEIGKNGWVGVTSYPVSSQSQYARLRSGFRVYERSMKNPAEAGS
jgi:hypothetical protein